MTPAIAAAPISSPPRALPEALRTPILVVDDVQDNRELIEELLRDEGYQEIISAPSGAQALRILEERPEVGLVLLDLMMPEMDGYEVCRRISSNSVTAHIPVIVITGGAVRRDEALLKSFERGAMDFIPKPVNEVELYGRVKSALLLYWERMHNREKTRALLESQHQLRQAQQLESIGRLAAGVAHDFNNLLAAVLGQASFMRLHLAGDSPLQASLAGIEQASTRASELCNQMLAYAGEGRYVVETIDLNSLIVETVNLLKISINKKITLNLIRSPRPALIKADVAQIRQVLMNLVLNAAEAIGDKTGSIAVRISRLLPKGSDFAEAILRPESPAGEYVQLEIMDSGCGMSKETQQKIFEPFFTTKFTGRGLGLSAVLGIVKAHQGCLKIFSEPGQGTTFNILLPTIEGAAGDVHREKTPTPQSTWRGKGTVLVVDDEISVRESTRILLSELGFKVLLAEDGQAGLSGFMAHLKEIVAVILDLTMPGLNGEEVFAELQKVCPEIPVLLCSGYSRERAMTRFDGKGLAGFLHKPFTLDDLALNLRECLEPD
jgi:CheY-like chemotaxis protein